MQANDTKEYHPPPRIFLVDDEEILSWCIELVLAAQGFQVKAARSLRESRELLLDFRPDLLICDQGLPDGWGTELIQEFQRDSKDIPVIMITAFPPPAPKEWAAMGAPVCLRKPFALHVLSERVHQALHLPALEGTAIFPDPEHDALESQSRTGYAR